MAGETRLRRATPRRPSAGRTTRSEQAARLEGGREAGSLMCQKEVGVVVVEEVGWRGGRREAAGRVA